MHQPLRLLELLKVQSSVKIWLIPQLPMRLKPQKKLLRLLPLKLPLKQQLKLLLLIMLSPMKFKPLRLLLLMLLLKLDKPSKKLLPKL